MTIRPLFQRWVGKYRNEGIFMCSFPLRVPALKVKQPLGDFFVISLPARIVRQVTFLDPTRIERVDKVKFLYSLLGAQRVVSSARAKKIAKYINTVEAAFPNSIILSANYINEGELQEDVSKRWSVEDKGNGSFELVVPTSSPMASVIDGQHRLLGFDHCDEARKDMELICSVYIDLPHAYQAYLFATININQRKVDKSLAYEQFGYNLDDEAASEWSPDKLAVFLTRKLNLKSDSPLFGHIKIAPIDDKDTLQSLFPGGTWQISTAAVVEGIMRLISSNPKNDRETLHAQNSLSRKRNILLPDKSPWREMYLKVEDAKLFELLEVYFSCAATHLFVNASTQSYINKTIGIQALFDLLAFLGKPIDAMSFKKRVDEIFAALEAVDFSNPFYQASGKGRVRVKYTLLFLAGLVSEEQLPDGDRQGYAEIRQLFRKPVG
jgi:DNA phosphorothioation-associated DGQHR protein 1